MILKEVRPNIETFGQMDEKFFSIGDLGMVFDILRNKMYSDPILAICREITCNARDSHREVGTPEVPIQIQLPNKLDPSFKIKDFGLGLSPERIENIYMKYGVSTKRESNLQTGCWGLGKLTPFAYIDSFSIVTNVDNKQYNYVCFIDETKVGKLLLLSTAETSEPNGTEIVIPVKNQDFKAFKDGVEKSTRHWDVKPVILGDKIEYLQYNIAVEGNNWKMYLKTNSWEQEIILIIDGIEYPLNLDSIKSKIDIESINSLKGSLLLYFETGDLSISANREQIYLDEATIDLLKIRLDRVFNEINDKIQTKINSFDNLWDAYKYRFQAENLFRHSYCTSSQFNWNGITLNSRQCSLPQVVLFSKNYYRHRDKIRRTIRTTLHFDENSELFIDDLGLTNITSRHVQKVFDDDKDIKSIQIICPTSKVTEEDLNKLHHVDLMKPRRLSEITKAPRTCKKLSEKLLIFHYENGFRLISLSDFKKDTRTKVLIKLGTSSNSCKYATYKDTYFNNMPYIARKFPDITFIGVNESKLSSKVFANIELFDNFINRNYDESLRQRYIRIKAALQYHCHGLCVILNEEHSKLSSLINKESQYHKIISSQNEILNLCSQQEDLRIFESAHPEIKPCEVSNFISKNPNYDSAYLSKQLADKYPLLECAQYQLSKNDILKNCADYINLIDEKENKCKTIIVEPLPEALVG